ncbi:MAG: DUF3341 domain-containing protein [Saprospirales bacterium]|nr:MAG: DUF3341 domain-containing protein [Saprospirales bacterium]
MANSKNVLFGLYNDDDILIDAIKTARNQKLDIMDVFTPFPVHGLDPALGLAESRIHIAGFVFGLIGAITAMGFMSWISVSDWPIIYGGKPYWPVLSFIPITFELTVLFSAVGMVIVFFTICGLGPGVTAKVLDPRITDDMFCIAFDVSNMEENEKAGLQKFFEETGASEINQKSI